MERKDYPFIVNFFEPGINFDDLSIEDLLYAGNDKVQDILLTVILFVKTYGLDNRCIGEDYVDTVSEVIYDKMCSLNEEEREYVVFKMNDALERINGTQDGYILEKLF